MTTTTTPETITLQDPGFKLPPAIAASIARANTLMEKQGTAPEDTTPPAGDANAVAPEAQPDTTPAPDTAVTPPVTHEPPADGKPVDWEGRYKAMKGRFDRAQEQLATATADIAELRRQLAHAHAARPAAPTPASTPTFTAEDLTDEERADYGDDLLKVVDKVAGRKIASVIGEFEKKFDTISQKVEGVSKVTQLSAKERFEQTLTNRVPNWLELNQNRDFLNWLDQLDPFSGQTRQDLLTNAYQLGDAPRCAAIFESFVKEANPSAAPQTETKAAPKPSGKVPLESLAAPGRARSTAPDAGPGDKPIIARSDIDKFFADVRRGVYRGKEAEKNRREAEIFEAMNEGRVS